jgi:hypothetical protein
VTPSLPPEWLELRLIEAALARQLEEIRRCVPAGPVMWDAVARAYRQRDAAILALAEFPAIYSCGECGSVGSAPVHNPHCVARWYPVQLVLP